MTTYQEEIPLTSFTTRQRAVVVRAEGSHYEIGEQIGRQCAAAIRAGLSGHTALQQQWLPYSHTTQGQAAIARLLTTATHSYPQYVSEIRGMADGAGVDFHQLWLEHLNSELRLLTQDDQVDTNNGCTDLYLNTDDQACVAHSEDVNRDVRDLGYIVEVHILPDKERGYKEEKFTAYTYPGGLAGNAMSVSGTGLCCSLNILYPHHINHQGLPRRMVNRAMMAAGDVDTALTIARSSPGPTVGFNMTFSRVTSSGQTLVTCLEVGATSGEVDVDVRQVSGFDHHCNVYLHLDEYKLKSLDEQSSVHRHQVIGAIVARGRPQGPKDLLTIMSDISDPEYPIFREGRDPDKGATASIVIFDLKRRVMELYRDRPATNPPVYTTDIPHFIQTDV